MYIIYIYRQLNHATDTCMYMTSSVATHTRVARAPASELNSVRRSEVFWKLLVQTGPVVGHVFTAVGERPSLKGMHAPCERI